MELTAVGFEPTQLALVELESTPLDHSGKLSLQMSNLALYLKQTGWDVMDAWTQRAP